MSAQCRGSSRPHAVVWRREDFEIGVARALLARPRHEGELSGALLSAERGLHMQISENFAAIDFRRQAVEHRAALVHHQIAVGDAFGEG